MVKISEANEAELDGGQISVYCRKHNMDKWLSIPKEERANMFNKWLEQMKVIVN